MNSLILDSSKPKLPVLSFYPYKTSHTSSPLSVPSYSTLPWVTWEAITGVEGSPDEGYYDTHWLMGHWSNQAKVEGTMLKAVWPWGSDCSVVHDPLGKPGCTPL